MVARSAIEASSTISAFGNDTGRSRSWPLLEAFPTVNVEFEYALVEFCWSDPVSAYPNTLRTN